MGRKPADGKVVDASGKTTPADELVDQGQRLSLARCRPDERADIGIDHSDFARTTIVRRTDRARFSMRQNSGS